MVAPGRITRLKARIGTGRTRHAAMRGRRRRPSRRDTPAASRAARAATWRGWRPRAGRRWRRRRADGDGRDRHALRHLHDRQQRIESVQRRALHGHADDRQDRVRRDHAGQMGGAAGAGNDHLEPAARGRRGVLGHQRRRAMRGHDFRLRGARRTASRMSSACRMVSQSDLLPMMTPTRGAGSGMRLFHHE